MPTRPKHSQPNSKSVPGEGWVNVKCASRDVACDCCSPFVISDSEFQGLTEALAKLSDVSTESKVSARKEPTKEDK